KSTTSMAYLFGLLRMIGRKRTVWVQNAATQRLAATAEEARTHSPGLIPSIEKVKPLSQRMPTTNKRQRANLNLSKVFGVLLLFANSALSTSVCPRRTAAFAKAC